MRDELELIEHLAKIDLSDIKRTDSLISDIELSVRRMIRYKENNVIISYFKGHRNELYDLIFDLDFNDPDNLKSFYLGKIAFSMSLIEYEMNEAEKIAEFDKLLKNNTYVIKLLKLLNEKGFVRNQELLNELKLTKSNLSNMLDRLEKQNIYVARKISREKHYYLTKRGKDLINYLGINKNIYEDIEVGVIPNRIGLDSEYSFKVITIGDFNEENQVIFEEKSKQGGYIYEPGNIRNANCEV